MSAIRGRDTKPELVIRKGLHARGFRFRVSLKDLPGRPDIVLPKYKAVIFVHGCFWHRHDCHLFKWPKTREAFWRDKIEGNTVRDQNNLQQLAELGWRIAIVWECALKGRLRQDPNEIVSTLETWIKSKSPLLTIEGTGAAAGTG